MPSRKDLEFGQKAVVLGFIKTMQLAKCIQLQNERSISGENRPLWEWMLREKYLQPWQVESIRNDYDSTSVIDEEINSSSLVASSMTQAKLSSTTHTEQQKKLVVQPIAENLSTLVVGSSFDRYEIVQQIGQGGMGIVYKAFDAKLERTIAIKVISSGYEAGTLEIKRFLREAKATAKLQHPNIVTVYDIGTNSGRPFFTMDYIEGISLKKLIDSSALSLKQTVNIMSAVGDAVQHAHEQGIIHRDLKPENVMMKHCKQPLVMDFGLAKLRQGEQSLTLSGMVMGTIHYMSPEQAQGDIDAIDQRSDIYALGVMLYEMLTGVLPFSGKSYQMILHKILQEQPTLPSELNKDIPKSLESICIKAMSKKKQHRYQHATEFVADLSLFAKGEKTKAKTLGFLARLQNKASRNKNMALAIMVTVLLITVSLVFYQLGRAKHSPASIGKQARQNAKQRETSSKKQHVRKKQHNEQKQNQHEVTATDDKLAKASLALAKQEQAKREQAKREQAKREQAKREQAKREQAKLLQQKQNKQAQKLAANERAARAWYSKLPSDILACQLALTNCPKKYQNTKTWRRVAAKKLAITKQIFLKLEDRVKKLEQKLAAHDYTQEDVIAAPFVKRANVLKLAAANNRNIQALVTKLNALRTKIKQMRQQSKRRYNDWHNKCLIFVESRLPNMLAARKFRQALAAIQHLKLQGKEFASEQLLLKDAQKQINGVRKLFDLVRNVIKKNSETNNKIVLYLLQDKFIEGTILNAGNSRFVIRDSKGKIHKIHYREIKGRYVQKLLPQNQDCALYLGILLYCEKDYKLAEKQIKLVKQNSQWLQRITEAKRAKDDLDFELSGPRQIGLTKSSAYRIRVDNHGEISYSCLKLSLETSAGLKITSGKSSWNIIALQPGQKYFVNYRLQAKKKGQYEQKLVVTTGSCPVDIIIKTIKAEEYEERETMYTEKGKILEKTRDNLVFDKIVDNSFYDYQGQRILDMTTELWRNLPHVEQRNNALLYRQKYARSHNLPMKITLFVRSINFTMCLIPPGRFWMGSRATEQMREENETRHKVIISKPFYLGKYEMTQAQWAGLSATKPWENQECSRSKASDAASYISFQDIQELLSNQRQQQIEFKLNNIKLSLSLASLKTISLNKFALPSEAQWEYACRAGTSSAFYWVKRPEAYAWFKMNTPGTHALGVGQKKANAWGLCDMSGNVTEWCRDHCWNDQNNYIKDCIDPLGTIGELAIVRGGSWKSPLSLLRSAARDARDIDSKSCDVGVRLILQIP